MSVTIQNVVPCFDPLHEFSKKRTEAALNAFLVDFSTTNVLLFEGMLCSCKVLHSVPTNSSRCLVNQGAILPSSASRSSQQAPVSILLWAIPCLIMQKLDFWKQQPQIFANLKENFFFEKNHHLNHINPTMLISWWSISLQFQERPWKKSLMAVRFRFTLTKLHRTVLKAAET